MDDEEVNSARRLAAMALGLGPSMTGGSIPPGLTIGAIVKRDNRCFASSDSEFDSLWLHQLRNCYARIT